MREELAKLAAATTDGCPECFRGPNGPLSLTVGVDMTRDPSEVVGLYRCVCGHQWTTSWNLDVVAPAL